MEQQVLVEEIKESRVLTEIEEGGQKSFYIEGIFMQADIKNQNQRVYPKKVLQEAVGDYTNRHIKLGRGYGELGHPTTPGIHMDRVCILTKELREDGSNWIGKAKVINTPAGKIVQEFLKEGVTLGVSSRGRPGPKGIRNGVVQEGFTLVTAVDVVADPSAPEAFVSALMEGKEYVWDNGLIVEKDIEEIRNGVEKANASNLAHAKIAALNAFFSKLRG